MSLQQITVVWRKIGARGWRWFWLRLAEKLVDPSSSVGRYLHPVFTQAQKLKGSGGSDSVAAQFTSLQHTVVLFYDLQVAPITFNVIDDLVGAEMMRRRLGLSDVHVVIVPGRNDGLRWENAEYDTVVDRATRYWRLHNIVIASFSLLPTCSGYTLCSSRQHAEEIQRGWPCAVYPEGYTTGLPVPPLRQSVIDRVNSGEQVFPALTAPVEAMRFMRRRLEAITNGRKPVVITLRSYPFMPQRNPRPELWGEFAHSLDRARYIPIFVPDTHAVPDPVPEALKSFVMMPEVALNLQLRMALYECAWLNMANMHGPMELCWYNERCRYVIFQEVDTAPQTSRAAIKADGYVFGEQLQWATPLQRWVWEGENAENLRHNFSEMETLIESSVQG